MLIGPPSPVEIAALKTKYLSALKASEQTIHEFFEKHSEVFPLPFYIGHHLQWDALISKFPLDTSLITDFVYVTRTSNTFLVVLVELEKPSKRIFTPKDRQIAISPEFAAAQGQIFGWQSYVRDNRKAVLDRLSRMMPRGEWGGTIDFRYVLVYGREAEFIGRQDRKDRFNSFSDQEIHYLTYDSVWGRFERNQEPRKRHILKLIKDRFTFKVLADQETHIFGRLGPDRFKVSSAHRRILISNGYEIDAWEGGCLLGWNNKYSHCPEALSFPAQDKISKKHKLPAPKRRRIE